MLVSFFSSNIPLYIEKNPVDKLCKVLEIKYKTCTPVSSKFVFEKLKFKVLHYVQHDFICQCAGTLIAYHEIHLRRHSDGYITRTTRLPIRLAIRSTRLSTRNICLSTRSTRSNICRSFYN